MNNPMTRSLLVGMAALLLLPVAARADDPVDVTAKGKTITLFDGASLDGWSVFVDPNADRYDPESSAEGIFTAEDGVLHVTGERYGCLTTVESYTNYHLTLEFKWGEQTWAPRKDELRDSGILLHCQGPEKVWMKSIECQIMVTNSGDFHLVDGTSLTVRGESKTGGRFLKTTDAEKPVGEWNTVEVLCDGDAITNIVNGTVVNEGTGASESAGRILLQSEGAEIFFRNVKLEPLDR